MNSSKNVIFHSVISSIQKVALYETKTKLYLIGSNDRETRFRVLEIDRTHPKELIVQENVNEIEVRDIRRLVGQIPYTRKISAYGILGFVRFLEGYYIILITKRTRCAVIGQHLIYTIKDTVMIRVNNESTNVKQPHPLETRYVKMFQNIDLNSNFYFSYSYDLTRTLQYNMSAPRFIDDGNINIECDEPLPEWSNDKTTTSSSSSSQSTTEERCEYAFRSVSRKRFVWNEYLLKRTMTGIMHKDWNLDVIHGFISQSNLSIFGRPIYICLIARRSTKFAGTRFLKRGANFMGDVANEVESEQIVIDGNRMCSFTQMRGSIPSHWSQDISKMVPKPPISLDLSDPYARTPAKHFQRILFQFGAPIIILNLVKKREKRKHESILTEEMYSSVKYLNQYLPPQFRIKYIHFDMARKSRGASNVMRSLADIAGDVIQQTSMFFNDPSDPQMHFQTGIVRVNCVDCLDRTNTAQFAIGKCALAHQLHRLGFIKPPILEFDSDCVTLLENLYEDHGDTLALQYGGSQLVHRIKTYRKTAAWASQGNDIMQTLSRYYSNTFSDTEKQHSINLFLGYFIPNENNDKENVAIWELQNDYYMHNLQNFTDSIMSSTIPLTKWTSSIILKHLPYSTSDSNKIVSELIRVHSKDLEMIDYYSNYHLPYKWTSFDEHIAFQISHLARNYMPTFRTNFSPFEPGRRPEERGSLKNPSLTGHSSTGSTNSSLEEDSSSDDEESTLDDRGKSNSAAVSKLGGSSRDDKCEFVSFASLLPSMKTVYGNDIKLPDKRTLLKYKRYVHIGKLSLPSVLQNTAIDSTTGNNNNNILMSRNMKSIKLYAINDYGLNSYEQMNPPPSVDKYSKGIYQDYTQIPQKVFSTKQGTSQTTIDLINKYIECYN